MLSFKKWDLQPFKIYSYVTETTQLLCFRIQNKYSSTVIRLEETEIHWLKKSQAKFVAVNILIFYIFHKK